jgi:hypothetical protein
MTTAEQLTSLLARFRYKPDFSFTVTYTGYGYQPALAVQMITTDTYHPENGRVPVVLYVPIPEVTISDEDMLRWLRECLRYMENHEIDEWIVVDGQRPFDPHSGRVPQPPMPDLLRYGQPAERVQYEFHVSGNGAYVPYRPNRIEL